MRHRTTRRRPPAGLARTPEQSAITREQVENFSFFLLFWQDGLQQPGGLAPDWSAGLWELVAFARQHGYTGTAIQGAAAFIESQGLQAAFEAFLPGRGQELLTRLPRDGHGHIRVPLADE